MKINESICVRKAVELYIYFAFVTALINYLFASLRWKGNIRRRPRLSSLTEEGGAPPHHQPQLLCRNQRPRNWTTDVSPPPPFREYTVCICILFQVLFKNKSFSLFRIKEKFPYAFDDICLYSEVSYLLSHCAYRLTSRRFIQELFQDVQFMPVRDCFILNLRFSKTDCVFVRTCVFIFVSPPPLPDVWGSRGNPDKATKTCWRGCRPSSRILIVLSPPLHHPCSLHSCSPGFLSPWKEGKT